MQGLKYMIIKFDDTGTTRVFPSANPAVDNEASPSDGVCQGGRRVRLHAVVGLTEAATMVQIYNGASISIDEFTVETSAAALSKVYEIDLEDGLGASFASGFSGAGDVAMIIYTPTA